MEVNVLGTPYEIIYKEEKEDPRLKEYAGYCDYTVRNIVIRNTEDDDILNYQNMSVDNKRILRHELIHAFATESGLDIESSWAVNEEMVDWVARQFPKMLQCFKQANAI